MPSARPWRTLPPTLARATNRRSKNIFRKSNYSRRRIIRKASRPRSWRSRPVKPSPRGASWRCRRNGLNWLERDRVKMPHGGVANVNRKKSHENDLSSVCRSACLARRLIAWRGQLGSVYRSTWRRQGEGGGHLHRACLVGGEQIDRRL